MNVTLSVGEREDDPEKSIKEFKQLAGKGNTRGWRFNRYEIHSRQNRREIDGVRIVNPFGYERQ